MILKLKLLLLFLFLCILSYTNGTRNGHPGEGKETWGYVEVRPGAHMFWWLYYTTALPDYKQRPLVLWLQGGPGASSTGFGNFMEIGPLDLNLNNRTDSWVSHVNVLFVDNPVGSGFSYVDNPSLLVTNNSQIASDLLEMFSKFLQKVPEFQTIPLYIFSESYGGKMAAQFALSLYKRISVGKLKCDLKGVSLGDSWISPVDSVLTWAPFLYSTSMVDNAGFQRVNQSAYKVKQAEDKGQWKKATDLWDQTEAIIGNVTNGVNVYNILQTIQPDNPKHSKDIPASKSIPQDKEILSLLRPSVVDILQDFKQTGRPSSAYTGFPAVLLQDKSKKEQDSLVSTYLPNRHLRVFASDPLSALMNGKVKQMLRIIPENVIWAAQSQLVFQTLQEDFMKPVVKVVENLLNNTPIAVNVYSGQLDLIVDTMGTIKWVEEMNWDGISDWKKAARTPVVINGSTEMFVKSFKNFGFYWILKAGHMVPADAPSTSIEMLKLMTNLKK